MQVRFGDLAVGSPFTHNRRRWIKMKPRDGHNCMDDSGKVIVFGKMNSNSKVEHDLGAAPRQTIALKNKPPAPTSHKTEPIDDLVFASGMSQAKKQLGKAVRALDDGDAVVLPAEPMQVRAPGPGPGKKGELTEMMESQKEASDRVLRVTKASIKALKGKQLVPDATVVRSLEDGRVAVFVDEE